MIVAVRFFDFRRLVVGVVGVGRFVAVGVGLGFEVPVGVVGVFRGVPERIGDVERPALGVAFDFRREFRCFAAFDVPAGLTIEVTWESSL